jgi:hypothetical protein
MTKRKKLGPAERRASVKALWAEASFCLEFCFLLVKQKEG